ncbi:MAG: protein kinase [Planctomycetota bacterium]|nr:protein kinase [Planctomycetota bacterium]
MALTPGTRLGPYEITAQIGVGGMGEVYRATDTTLNRQVAVKVLPESLASDAERIARFEREAKTLASLNHPNIAAIYGLEEPRRESDDRKRNGHPSSQSGTLTGIGACARPRHNSGGAYA